MPGIDVPQVALYGGVDWMDWPLSSPRLASGIIYAFIVILIIVVIFMIVGWVKFSSESYGMPGKGKATIDSEGAGQPFFRENFSATTAVNPLELAPSKTLIFDDVDQYGQYRVGTSKIKYYVVKDANGVAIKDKEGYIMYLPLNYETIRGESGEQGLSSAMDVLRTNWSDPKAYTNYAANCKKDIIQATYERDAKGKVTGYSDPWGWLSAQARAGTGMESFDVAAQDELLSQKAQGL